MDKELIADIRNKLTPAMTALDLLSKGKEVSNEFIEMAKKELDEAVKIMSCKQDPL